MKKFLSIVVAICLIVSACLVLTACQDKDFYDSITKKLKLNKSYEGKSFLVNGIGKAKVAKYVDGDTTQFYLEQDQVTITIRYHSIDTPESTGGVEKWGKAASNFTKHQLESATEIVLESHTGGAAKHDSYGVRYLGYVWYKPAGSNSFKNLNLELVENGYSKNTGDGSSDYPYNSYFNKADDFASRKALHVWASAGVVDPLYNENAVELSLKQLWTDIYDANDVENDGYNRELFVSDNEGGGSGAKIKFRAYLESLDVYNDAYTFTAVSYDPKTGERYEIKVFCMYANYSQSKMKIGHLYDIIGSIQRHSNSFQISGVSYNSLLPDMKDATKVVQRDYFLTFDSEEGWYENLQWSATLYEYVTVTEIVGTADGVLTFKGTARQRIGANDYDQQAREFTFTINANAAIASQIVVGAKLKLGGYQFTYNDGNITISDYHANKIVVKGNNN